MIWGSEQQADCREWEEEEEKSGGASQSRSEGMKVRPSLVYTHIVDSRGV